MSDKEIRFIDSSYNELFRIKDGESITISDSDGEKVERECKYIDDYHAYIGNRCFHICEFAEVMERRGRTYRPKDTPGYVLEKISQEEFGLAFASGDGQNRGCICYVRGYFDTSIHERFQSSAMIESRENYKKYKTPDFSLECDNIINYFRFQAKTPLLKSRIKMSNAGYDLGAERLKSDEAVCGYRVTTEKNVYYLRCDPRQGQYNLYMYAYDKEALTRYLDSKFAEQNYGSTEKTMHWLKQACGIGKKKHEPER